MHYTQEQGIKGVTLDDIYLGNGASELIVMATNALLDNGDELLVPAPDYPLWTAAVSLSGGTPVHYLLRRSQRLDARPGRHPRQDHAAHQGHRGHQPQQPDRRAVFGRVAARPSCEIAREHELVIFADEVYDKVLYDGATPHRIGQPGRRRADADLQLAVQELPLLRLPRRLDGGLGRQEACARTTSRA